MIHAPNELREVVVGATVNLFVSVGQTSRRLKGTVSETRERGAGDEVMEVTVVESTPGGSEIVFWIGCTDEETFLLPLDAEDEALVYVKYKHNGGQTGLYIDSVREVAVRDPSAPEVAVREDESTTDDGPANEDVRLTGDGRPSDEPTPSGQSAVDDRSPRNGRNTLK